MVDARVRSWVSQILGLSVGRHRFPGFVAGVPRSGRCRRPLPVPRAPSQEDCPGPNHDGPRGVSELPRQPGEWTSEPQEGLLLEEVAGAYATSMFEVAEGPCPVVRASTRAVAEESIEGVSTDQPFLTRPLPARAYGPLSLNRSIGRHPQEISRFLVGPLVQPLVHVACASGLSAARSGRSSPSGSGRPNPPTRKRGHGALPARSET